MKLVKWFLAAGWAWCCVVSPVRGRDVGGAEKMNPDVPDNLDRRQMKDREAIQRFMIALMLEHMVLKWSRKDAEHDVEAMRREMASFPIKALDRCPEDFKEIWRDILFTSIREKVPLKKLPADDLKKLEFQMRVYMDKYNLQRFASSPALLNFVLLTLNPRNIGNPDKKDWSRRAASLRARLETGNPPVPSVEEMMEWSGNWERKHGFGGEDPWEDDGENGYNTLLWYVFGLYGDEDEEQDDPFS